MEEIEINSFNENKDPDKEEPGISGIDGWLVMIVVFAKKRYYFVKLTTMAFVLITIYNIFTFLFTLIRMPLFFFMYSPLYTIFLAISVIDIVIMILWIVYISKSERVYNTFRGNVEYHI